MSFTQRTSSLQAYHTLLYRAPLHPEFFRIEAREKGTHADFEFESWLFSGGHAFRFEYDEISVTEVVTDEPKGLPERGLLTTLPCAGEKDHEAEIADRITYVTSIQTETLSDHLYLGTYREMLEHGRMCQGLLKVWDTGGHPNLSLVEHQRYADEVHLQGYHLRSDCQMVLRTQSIFQIGCNGTSNAEEETEESAS
ncbi:MAG: hypothetical protein CMJ29_02230 [Phycisphaerae bacterium]|nr:hypothetical protein [Phycisphaerae bacterium]|tara:strand:+ start:1715 stop:2302 length:588 start_codon:yes stop_codon:yes gene_type:complete